MYHTPYQHTIHITAHTTTRTHTPRNTHTLTHITQQHAYTLPSSILSFISFFLYLFIDFTPFLIADRRRGDIETQVCVFFYINSSLLRIPSLSNILITARGIWREVKWKWIGAARSRKVFFLVFCFSSPCQSTSFSPNFDGRRR
jgi:hypothetical protein